MTTIDLRLLEGLDREVLRKSFEAFEHESDRGVVLVSLAILDEIISARLNRLLRQGNSDARSRLLNPPLGAFSGFSSKVDLAYCIGLIPQALYGDVRLLNRLRNKCAHNWETFHITAEVFEKFVAPMFMAKALKSADEYGDKLAVERSSIKLQFLTGRIPSDKFKMVMSVLIPMANMYKPPAR
jgi:DNA-binding MltR family transcriptional regulator